MRRHRRAERPRLDRSAVRYMVYRLHDDSGVVLYVGRSCDVRSRIKAHHSDAVCMYDEDRARKALWFFDCRSVSMLGPFTWDEAVRVERSEIEKYQPVGNRDFTVRDHRPAAAARSRMASGAVA